MLVHTGHVLPPIELGALPHLQSIIHQLCELSLKDPLTGLFNRRHFQSVLEREIEVVARSGEAALLLMLDIDHFKKINDTHGHGMGDEVLRSVAQTLVHCVRPMDTVARYGGEEFAVVLPSCQVGFGRQVAERIRESVAAQRFLLPDGQQLRLTISIGGAFAPRWVRSTPDLWVERADLELYRAKTEGRNRVCLEEQPVMAVSAEEKNLLFGALSLGDPAWIDGLTNGDGGVGSAIH